MREEQAPQAHSVFYSARQALRRHASGGNILIAATALALIVANIPGVSNIYFQFWDQEVRLQIGSFNLFSHHGHAMDMLAFINDALMAIFFFSIGLEIKREILVGELSSFRQALLPILAAVGGMAVPVLLFIVMGHGYRLFQGRRDTYGHRYSLLPWRAGHAWQACAAIVENIPYHACRGRRYRRHRSYCRLLFGAYLFRVARFGGSVSRRASLRLAPSNQKQDITSPSAGSYGSCSLIREYILRLPACSWLSACRPPRCSLHGNM